ncbi:uncharacterized protein EKO05_0004998 [Ascochyta rabiei]|uniref:uncharacterized protein n=1 Tax=Didymella rabiei TaxID=5454 RepID=UPI002209854B|nr:uncharacterized protein EKO05_0004998 [Ascochyta rabiei]UPX14519.1 hypothetical protein EKO05_0004998 [Ascochyta rabiei]
MQTSIGQRALSTLASKLHPQLPLTPRESQQLLTLLTTSFRTHLDREHPVHVSEKNQTPAVHTLVGHEDYRSSRATSSSALASQHIHAVLSNPLFAVKPSRRRSQSAASHLLKDPMGWFLNEIATGDATLSKASMCLDMLDKRTAEQPPQLHDGKTHGAMIADWLRSSGLDASKEFLEMCIAKPHTKRPSDTFLSRLVSLLIAHGKKPLVWKWYTRSCCSGLQPAKALLFRKLLLKHMVHAEASRDIYRGIVLFRRAYEMIGKQSDKSYEQLRPAGQYLVQAVMSKPTNTIGRELYNSFRHSTQLWINSRWSQAVDSMLWLHHPTTASAAPGLRFIMDPAGAATYANAIPSQRRFIVQLILGIARQLLEEESYRDAQTVMAFAKQHFPDLVLSNLSTEQQPVADRLSKKVERERRREERNLELLDSLVLT